MPRIVVASGVARERRKTDGRIADADCVAEERHVSVSSVLAPGGITIERLITGGRVGSDVSRSKIRLYIPGKSLKAHDVDNRMKDVMDALQGRAGGLKSERVLAAIILNDCQVYRVTMIKSKPPGQSRGKGYLIVRKHRK